VIDEQTGALDPPLSVIVPTYNNEPVLRRCLESWRGPAAAFDVELIVIEDGCRDGTLQLLDAESRTSWGKRHLRWIHLDDAHELRCTNAGFGAAKAPLLLAWQDDMFVCGDWLVPEVLATFAAYPDIGMMSLSRGLNHYPLDEPIDSWDDLVDWRRLQSTIGPFPGNWFHVQEVDAVIRPWAVRRACIERVGALDEAFVPTEWDEADLAYRIRLAGWKVGTCGYERLGGYTHLGSSTLGELGEAYKRRVLQNGRLFHQRWSHVVARDHARRRRTWRRRATLGGWVDTLRGMSARAQSRA
jgi:GT2 family glycosyltransferase